MQDEDEVRTRVRERYGAIARETASCCGPSCCAPEMAPDGLNVIGDAYQGVAGHVAEADLNLGCGVPTHHAALKRGETVLDLGSGAGNDVFIARHEVGAEGRVIGVDMTPDMIARARANARKLGLDNVEFRLGEIERLPVESGAVDAIISNCVLNLLPDKAPAFFEMFRVLRPGGQFAFRISSPPVPCPKACARRRNSLSAASPARFRGRVFRIDRSCRLRGRAQRQGAADRAARRGAFAAYERPRHRRIPGLRRRAQDVTVLAAKPIA